jgi:NADH-quinone oxidoreductase subunit G
MPKIVIDDQEIEVPTGTKVIQAAELLDIMIPRFCYHPALGSVGACRVCAVKFLQGPFKGVQMSCMIDAQDGMVVSTMDAEAVDFRKHVIEWLMLHHPHDCPVCDEGGHCLLQDMTVSGGHGIRRYRGAKRTYHDQFLGPLVQHEMNRCIHCYRCSRFYQEFSGYRDLGVMRLGNRTYFGRYEDGTLESPFSGNLTDICPTGVYTDKPSRFFGRRWDYERSPSVCINCSLGCHTIASARYRDVVRQEARFSEVVNGYFLCDRGRHGFSYNGIKQRPRYARIGAEEVSWEDAVQAAAKRLNQISREAGPGSLAWVGSTRNSLETLAMLKRLCHENDWQGPALWTTSDIFITAQAAVSNLGEQAAVSLRELEKADFILTIGTDPLNEAPMLALAMRQAQRAGAGVVVIDPRPVDLPFEFHHLAVSPKALNPCLGSLIKASVDRTAAESLGQSAVEFYDAILDADLPQREQLQDIVKVLNQSQNPVIVCGTQVVTASTPVLAAAIVSLLRSGHKNAGLFYTLPGANAFGAALLSEGINTLEQVLQGIEKGAVRSLVLVEADPFWHFPNRQRFQAALEKLDLIVVLDYVNARTLQQAHIFLPTATVYETGGIFVNQEGRVQAASQIFRGGVPISQVCGGDHPPRKYGVGMPGADHRPAWLTLAAIAYGEPQTDEETLRPELEHRLAELNPVLADLPSIHEIPENGIRLNMRSDEVNCFSLDWPAEFNQYRKAGDELQLLLVDWTFGTEELSAYSPHLKKVERSSCLFMHSGTAEKMGLQDSNTVVIRNKTDMLEVRLCLSDNMAEDVIVLPRHRELTWQIFEKEKIFLRADQIRKVN